MPDDTPAPPQPAPSPVRLDKWLWFARFFKSRALARTAIVAGEIRIDGRVCDRPAQPVRIGARIELPAGPRMRRQVIVLALGERRGPAPEARRLYRDLGRVPGTEDDPGAPNLS